jgi:hypothetical protein
MRGQLLLKKIAAKDSDKEKLAGAVIKQPELLSEVLAGLGSEEAPIKYGCAKVVRLISEREPAVLYPRMEFLVELLDSGNQILKWGAIIAIGNLAAVDSKRKIAKILDRYLEPIPGPELITASNVINGAAEIAMAKPRLTDRIVDSILKVERARYATPECRNVAIGHAIVALGRLFDRATRKDRIVRFIGKQTKNSRNATRKKAERFMKRMKA